MRSTVNVFYSFDCKQKNKMQSQILGMSVILQTFFTAFNLYKSNKYRRGLWPNGFLLPVSHYTEKKNMVRWQQHTYYPILWDFLHLKKEMFRMEQDTSLVDDLVYIWVWWSFKPRNTPAGQFRVLGTRVKFLHTSQQWQINYETNLAHKW